jgi:hypothetical protein
VRGGLMYFTAGLPAQQGKDAKASEKRVLVCADVATGSIKWTKELQSSRLHPYLPEDVGPAISAEGNVFVVDLVTRYMPCPTSSFVVQAYSASSGELIDQTVVPLKNSLGRFFLRDEHGEPNVYLPPNGKPDA